MKQFYCLSLAGSRCQAGPDSLGGITLGDYRSSSGLDTHMTLEDAREKARNQCNGLMKESREGYTTYFIEESTGTVVGEYYER